MSLNMLMFWMVVYFTPYMTSTLFLLLPKYYRLHVVEDYVNGCPLQLNSHVTKHAI